MGHVHEKIDFTAEVFIVYKNKVLLRMHDKYHIWLSVGGHIELDEDPNEAAVREVKEEVGLDVKLWSSGTLQQFPIIEYKELIPPVSINRHRVFPTHEHVTFVYFASAEVDTLVLSEDERTADCRWLTKSDLDALDLAPNVRHFATEALETMGSK